MQSHQSAGIRRAPPTFLSLPSEIRLIVYELLLVDAARKYSCDVPRQRTSYWVKAGLRSATLETSYVAHRAPELHTAILFANHQIHAEAVQVLYRSYVFDFGSDVEGVVPFLSDLTAPALAAIRRMNLVKRALPYTRDFDRYEWSTVCEFLAKRLELQHLGLGVAGGKPTVTDHGTAAVDTFNKSDFKLIAKFDGMEWMQELVAIKGLRNLDIRTIWEVCPPPCSNALAFFVNFSASIECGFAEYLRENMVAGAA